MVSLALVSGVHGSGTTAASDLSAYRFFRSIEFPGDMEAGPVAIPLDSSILEKCRPDGADLMVVTSKGTRAKQMFEPAREIIHPEPFPARVYRTAVRPGKCTDIWVDKSAKVVTGGLEIRTDSQNFVRRVELRGSDDGRESFVIRMDALICDIQGPVPVHSLIITHPLNNFRYIHVRIQDGGAAPLKVKSILCFPPMPQRQPLHRFTPRIIENRKDGEGGRIIVADLGPRRYPVAGLTVAAPSGKFIARAEISFASSAMSEDWKRVWQGTLFRLQGGQAYREQLTAEFKPQEARFLLVRLTGPPGQSVDVDSLEAIGVVPLLVMEYRPGMEYRLFYGNPSAEPVKGDPDDDLLALRGELTPTDGVRLGPEKTFIPPAPKKTQKQVHGNKGKAASYSLAFPVAALTLLSLLLLLFALMLGSRWLRRRRKNRISRLMDF